MGQLFYLNPVNRPFGARSQVRCSTELKNTKGYTVRGNQSGRDSLWSSLCLHAMNDDVILLLDTLVDEGC